MAQFTRLYQAKRFITVQALVNALYQDQHDHDAMLLWENVVLANISNFDMAEGDSNRWAILRVDELPTSNQFPAIWYDYLTTATTTPPPQVVEYLTEIQEEQVEPMEYHGRRCDMRHRPDESAETFTCPECGGVMNTNEPWKHFDGVVGATNKSSLRRGHPECAVIARREFLAIWKQKFRPDEEAASIDWEAYQDGRYNSEGVLDGPEEEKGLDFLIHGDHPGPF